jgi:hypothetical protein
VRRALALCFAFAPIACATAATRAFVAERPPFGIGSAPIAPVVERVADAPACEPLAVDVPEIQAAPIDVALPPLVDDGHTLAPFYERLARLARGGARDHVRIAVYGDSNMTMDFITGEMRRVLQRRYGDGGHGFVALGKPFSHYRHMDVKHHVRFGFASYAVSTKPLGDGGYGFSGIAAQSLQRGGITAVATADAPSPVGRAVSRVDFFYLKAPRFGAFEVRVDGAPGAPIDTRADAMSLGVHHLDLPDGPHAFDVVSDSVHPVRLLGAALERDRPGIVVDSLGVGSMNTKCMTRERPEINEPMLARRHYDLVVFMHGTNDAFTRADVPEYLAEVVAVHRAALPGVPILIVTPPDRGKTASFRLNELVVAQRREIARSLGTAFWSLFDAMGGQGSMARFYALRLAMSDGIHFNERGGAWVGDRLVALLLGGLRAYVAEHPDAGCGPDRAPADLPSAAPLDSISLR